MFSVVVVYNRERELNRILLPSLKKQTVEYEYVPIDNTKGTYKSAAEALNFGGRQAKGKYIVFLHQDTELGSDTWMADTEKLLDGIPDLGIAGIVGLSTEGSDGRGDFVSHIRGYMCSSGQDIGEPFEKPQEVQTLDECLLIVPQRIFRKLQFDTITFDGWHCYGCDYSLRVQEHGMKAYAISAYALHRHRIEVDTKYLLKYQKKLYFKHRNFSKIYTTCGEISMLGLIALPIRGFIAKVRGRLAYKWLKELEDCESVLDLGCGYQSPLQLCKVPYSVGVEIFEPYLEESQRKELHSEYIKADIRTIEINPKSFDGIFCFEVLEHLTKNEGQELLKKMDLWARKKVIVHTPNGYLWQDGYDANPFQEHKSGWTAAELRVAGFKVYGRGGWKPLRGPKAVLKYKPTYFWLVVSGMTQLIVHYFPQFAFQLLAIKKVHGERGDE